MKKGFVLITDMLLAISIMVVMVTSSVYVMRNHPDWKRVKETQMANDLLNIMDEHKVLQTLNSSNYSSFIQEYLPQQYNVELIVSVYNASALTQEIILLQNFVVNHPINASGPTDFGIVKKSFLIQEGRIKNFGVAEVRIWI